MSKREKGQMVMAGGLSFELKRETLERLLKGETLELNMLEKTGHDLIVCLKPGEKDGVLEFSPWFDLDEATVSIGNNFDQDNDGPSTFLTDYMEVEVKESEERSFAMTINPAQAAKIAEILMNYVRAWEACKPLRTPPAVIPA